MFAALARRGGSVVFGEDFGELGGGGGENGGEEGEEKEGEGGGGWEVHGWIGGLG